MSGWAPKRFWKEVSVAEQDGGFTVHLDGRPVKTPASAPLLLPTRAMAEAIAAEWDAQQGEIRPETMPMARFAHSAIDKVTPQFDAVAEIVAAYGASDLLCYRAETPERLVARQAEGWDPLLAWAGEALGAPLRTGSGVIPVDQPAESLDALDPCGPRLDALRTGGAARPCRHLGLAHPRPCRRAGSACAGCGLRA